MVRFFGGFGYDAGISLEVAVGLGIVISLFRNRESVNVEDMSLLKW